MSRCAAVLLDYDGVVVRLDPEPVLAAAARLEGWLVPPEDVIWGHFYGSGLTALLDCGELTYPQFWDRIRAEVWDGPAGEFAAWVRMLTDAYSVRPAMADLLADLAAHVPLALVTDNHLQFRGWLAGRPDIGRYFTAVVNSAEHGVCKPHPRLFATAADRLGVALDCVVFVDDAPKNVAGARELGLRAVLFSDAAALRADLADCLRGAAQTRE